MNNILGQLSAQDIVYTIKRYWYIAKKIALTYPNTKQLDLLEYIGGRMLPLLPTGIVMLNTMST